MARALVDLGLTRLELGKFAEAEAPLREGLAILEKASPESWERFDAMVLLGASLSGQKKYPEAEPLMVSGREGLAARESSIPAPNRGCLADAGRRLISLYTDWGKPEKAAEWKAKLTPSTPPGSGGAGRAGP